MVMNNLNSEIQSRISSFLHELSALVKRQALEAVHEALGEAAGPARSAPHKLSMRPARASRAMTSRGVRGKRFRRAPEDLAKLQANILAAVKSKQGQRLEELG